MKTSRMVAAGICLAALTLLNIGCGGGNNGPVLNQEQALNATSDFLNAVLYSAATGGFIRPGTVQAEVAGIRNAHPNDLPAAPSLGELRAVPVKPLTGTTIPTETFPCPSGGSITLNGSYSGTDTSATIDIVETINNCMDTDITMNGNPNVVVTGTFTNSATTFAQDITVLGGFNVGSNNCTVNATYLFTGNNDTGAFSESIVGSICGVSLNFSYSSSQT
jgi:hypothetical protein